VIEPLMGWTGADDTLATQVELTFDPGYAQRQGLSCRVQNEPLNETSQERSIDEREAKNRGSSVEEVGAIIWLTSFRTAYGRCNLSSMSNLERALVNPAAVFARPDDVVRHPLLSLDCKREILWRWAWDEYLIDLAAAEGMADGPPSRLGEVRAALVRLGHDWRPHPAAPAAFVVRYEALENALAA
jgi:hypothetical protein